MAEHCDKVVAAIFSQPWAMQREDFAQMVAIARRDFSDLAAVAEKRGQRERSISLNSPQNVAVIPVFGPIVPRASLFDDVSGAVSLTSLTAQLQDAVADPQIKSILLNIDSPGGQVTGVHEFAERIRAANKIKPVRAHVTGLCASAAYWIAAATSRITADETSKIGSVGIVYAWTDDSVAKEKEGVKDVVLTNSHSPDKHLDPNTPKGRAELQRLADETAVIFFKDVAKYRSTDTTDVMENYGKGKVFLAEQAREIGMIDALGVMDIIVDKLSNPNPQELSMARTGKTPAKGNPKNKPKNGNAEDVPHKDDDEEEEDDEQAAAAEADEEEEENDDEASEGGDEEDEEEEPKAGKGKANPKAKSAAFLAEIRAMNPEVYDAAFAAGKVEGEAKTASRERLRIQEIEELGICGHDELVHRAKYQAPMSAAKLSLAVLKAEGAGRRSIAADIRSESSGLYVKPDAATTGTAPKHTAEEKRIDALMSGQFELRSK